jgi:hypothetical protein
MLAQNEGPWEQQAKYHSPLQQFWQAIVSRTDVATMGANIALFLNMLKIEEADFKPWGEK